MKSVLQDVRDRQQDLALDEAMGREVPPDRRQEILSRLENPAGGAGSAIGQLRRLWPAALVILGLAVTIWVAWLQQQGTPPHRPELVPSGPKIRKQQDPWVTVHSRAAIRRLPASTTKLKGVGLKDADLVALTKLKNLRQLDLTGKWGRGPGPITDEGLAVLGKLPELRVLKLDWQRGVKSLAALTSLKHLHTLSLRNSGVTNDGLENLQQLPALRDLNLIQCMKVNDAGIEHVLKLKNLTRLNLAYMGWLSEPVLVKLDQLPNLESLSLAFIEGRTQPGAKEPPKATLGVTDNVMPALARLKKLKSLNVNGCGISDEGLAALGKLEGLKRLEVTWCMRISDDGVGKLPRNLEKLKLFGTNIQGHTLGRFGQLRLLDLNTCRQLDKQAIEAIHKSKSRRTLEELVISGCQKLDGDALKKVAEFPRLKRLHLTYSKWLVDEHLEILAPLRGHLEELVMGQCHGLTDDCLVHLKGFEKLKLLDLAMIDISEKAIAELKKGLPALKEVKTKISGGSMGGFTLQPVGGKKKGGKKKGAQKGGGKKGGGGLRVKLNGK